MMIWPPDYKSEIERRLRRRNRLIEDEDLRRKIMAWYAQSPIDWINDYCITFDPRAVKPLPRLMPFVLFPRQRDFIAFLQGCFNEKANGLVEKSRDMGASWLCCCFTVWLWLFHPGTVIGWGSNKEANVDKKGDPKAIFTKIRQILDNLPVWMLPEGYHGPTDALYMRIVNRINGCAITGESGENMGRSGRTSIYFKDESAHYEHAEMVEAALGDNTDVQIDISSVNGSNNVFYYRRMSGELWLPDAPPIQEKTRVFILDWRDHPGKTQEWYDLRHRKAVAEGLLHILAQEVDRNYSASIDRVIIKAEWLHACIDAHKVLGLKDDGEKVGGQDVADGGRDKNSLSIRHGIVMKFCQHWGGEADDALTVALPYCIQYGVRELDYDSIGVGSGFKSAKKNLEKSGAMPKHLKIIPWNAGGAVLDPLKHIIPDDKQSPTNEDQYLNLKAQAWFRLRARAYKTYRAVKFGDKYPEEELMSLDSSMPLLHELIMQLSQATHDSNSKGKTIVDKKPEGALSPNLADSTVICYCPIRQPLGFFSNDWKP